MITPEHRKPFWAFLAVTALAAMVLANGLREQAVVVLVQRGAPTPLIGALAPDLVLGGRLGLEARSPVRVQASSEPTGRPADVTAPDVPGTTVDADPSTPDARSWHGRERADRPSAKDSRLAVVGGSSAPAGAARRPHGAGSPPRSGSPKGSTGHGPSSTRTSSTPRPQPSATPKRAPAQKSTTGTSGQQPRTTRSTAPLAHPTPGARRAPRGTGHRASTVQKKPAVTGRSTRGRNG